MDINHDNVRIALAKNYLSQSWLINQLGRAGLNTSQSELSAALSGRRKGPKASQLVRLSGEIIQSYESRMGD